MRTLLVLVHQVRVAGDVGAKNGGETARVEPRRRGWSVPAYTRAGHHATSASRDRDHLAQPVSELPIRDSSGLGSGFPINARPLLERGRSSERPRWAGGVACTAVLGAFVRDQGFGKEDRRLHQAADSG